MNLSCDKGEYVNSKKMASLGSQFTLLLWKNFKLQGRKKCVTVFEILVPLFFAGLLLMIRAVVDSEYINHDTKYDRFSLSTISMNIEKDILLYTPSNSYTDALMTTVSLAIFNNDSHSKYVME